MGLSGRKVKQRIGKDPRNLSWADDANRFGQAYLEKFGWDASKGLGASGEGRTSAIKATQKLDMLGIGMQHQKDPNGIAWRQNRDFENLLRRLNEGGTSAVVGAFHKAREEEEEADESLKGRGEGGEQSSTSESGDLQKMNEEDEVVVAKKEKKREKKKEKKRKAAEALEKEEDPLDKKRRNKKRKKLLLKDGDDDDHAVASNDESEPPLAPPCPPESPAQQKEEESGSVPPMTAVVTAPVPIRAPPRTHRARIIAAKRMAASNSTALAEILGIPSSSTSSLSSRYPSTVITPSFTPVPAAAEEQEPLQTLTTSSQSVGDYFKAKLSAKTRRERQPATGDNAPTPTWDEDDDDRRPGLGLGYGASRAPVTDGLDEEQARGGIGASSSSKFAAMFTPSQATTDSQEDNAAATIDLVEARDTADQDDDHRKREKKRAKEEWRREKAERRRRKAEAGRLDGAVVDVLVGEASAGRTKKKRDESGTPGGDTQVSSTGETEVVRTKKRKGDKDKKSAKHGRAAE